MLSRPLLTLHEVAELLKVKEATVRSWIAQGLVRAAKFGREWRIAHKDLEAFVEKHMTVQGAPASENLQSPDSDTRKDAPSHPPASVTTLRIKRS